MGTLDRVTITGADDSTDFNQIYALTEEFNFVEWGILVSARQMGAARFPTLEWIGCLIDNADRLGAISVHVCGRWVRDMLVGIPTAMDQLGSLFEVAHRVQLNFHAEPHQVIGVRFEKLVRERLPGKQIIFQWDGVNTNLICEAIGELPDAVALFDMSGGAGIVPATWPKPFFINVTPGDGHGVESPAYHGYAGGLGPDTLERELPRIFEAAGDAPIWIDMETRVRSENDNLFDIDKVRRCLEICRPFVVETAKK